ncbi:N utilization substance protein B [Oleiphilus sp. HI0009]|uniref:transcription antitermination factor NusB n=1 Tax=unclassified Oleiphilus TaxID=2631174 RepID=UPI0007C26922|nr:MULTISPECIES: transcription antitermination factor NusB [unclassified Oleiphilus]KZX75446.1 N utilization substance protein B [Oleiphilus sp. HI0009]MCH2158886.1 transcription antitermination factor NusB [Oleiphilaceae bacterium]KZX79081.1 N utilization substance protein B [Oleiphilus sp. HI0009]KZY66333.1 N utilization substance protein B [Oleiphilus sp. HI0066]KZY67538.1 N utilization substance protein B [Oleiphilus sp. HI0066]
MSEFDSSVPKKVTTSQRKRARTLVLQALYQWQLGHSSTSQIEAEFRTDNDFGKIDQAYFEQVFRTIPSSTNELDQQYEVLLDRALEEVDPIELAILRIGTFELMHRIDIPLGVVINEAIELAKEFGGTDGHKYVNSILDKLGNKLRSAEASAQRK